MKKTNFMSGAIIATLGIIACKVLGLVYVIPFYSIIVMLIVYIQCL